MYCFDVQFIILGTISNSEIIRLTFNIDRKGVRFWFQCSLGDGTIELEFIKYTNKESVLADGVCCGDEGMSTCRSQCESLFNICLGSAVGNCTYVKFMSKEFFQDDLIFKGNVQDDRLNGSQMYNFQMWKVILICLFRRLFLKKMVLGQSSFLEI